jgi:hypothetical protein
LYKTQAPEARGVTVTFTLPASFDPGEFLTGRLLLQADAARWFIGTLVRKTANRDTDPWGCVALDSVILQRIMGRRYTDVIRALERGGAIETSGYHPGIKCRGYRLAKRYLGNRSVRVPCVDPWLLRRLEQERQRLDAKESQSKWLPIHFALDAEQRRLTIDPAADLILDSLPDHCRLCQHVLVDRLRHRELPFTISTTGRVFNAITGLKRELRAALRIGGEPLGSVDIRCAQPALLALEMDLKSPTNGLKGRSTYKHTLPLPPASAAACPSARCPIPSFPLPCPCPGSLNSFASLVLSGRLYEHLMALTGLDRESVKLGFLRDVLAKKGRYPSVVENAFRLEFPAVYQFIRTVNRNDHGELIRRLQRLESWLVIEQVAPRLVGRVPVVTLHDAIFSTRQSVSLVETGFREVFDAIGCRLALKCEGADRLPVGKIMEA